jgi:hypothetical protein
LTSINVSVVKIRDLDNGVLQIGLLKACGAYRREFERHIEDPTPHTCHRRPVGYGGELPFC